MMTLTLTVGGVTTPTEEGSVNLTASANGRNVVTFEVTSENGSVRPGLDQEIVLTRDGTTLFAGLITAAKERGLNNIGDTAITTEVSASDFNILPERRVLTITLAAGTLKSMLQTLVAYLSGYGVTLAQTQVNGPTLPECTYTATTLKAIFDDLSKMTGYVWEISYTKSLSMFSPSSSTAPSNITDSNYVVEGDLEIEPTRENYANRVYFRAGPEGEVGMVTKNWTCNGVQTSWVTDIPSAIPGANNGTLTLTPNGGSPVTCTVGPGGEFTFDAATSTLSLGTHSTPANLTVLSFEYLAQYPFTVMVEDAGEQGTRGLWEASVADARVTTYDTAVTKATAELAERILTARTARFGTYTHGYFPGQTFTINSTKRHLSTVTFTVTEVTANDLHDRMLYHVTAIEGTRAVGGWQDTYKAWTTGAPSSPVLPAASGGTITGFGTHNLGGSRNTAIQAYPSYQPVVDFSPFIPKADLSVRVRVELWARSAGVSCTARLYNVTDATSAGSSGALTSQTPAEATFTASLVAGKRYRLELVSGTSGEAVYGIGQLEAL